MKRGGAAEPCQIGSLSLSAMQVADCQSICTNGDVEWLCFGFTHAIGDERHYVFDCPHFAHIRRQFRSLIQEADGAMQ